MILGARQYSYIWHLGLGKRGLREDGVGFYLDDGLDF